MTSLSILLLFALLILIIGIPSQAYGEKVSTCECVVFRLDDVQDYWQVDKQISIMNTFGKHEAPLTLGIIANQFGNDTRIVNYVKLHLDRLEIANHGWDHEDFTKLSIERQGALMHQGNTKIESILNVKPDIFIPPFNTMNDDSWLQAQSIFRIVSGDIAYNPITPFHLGSIVGLSTYNVTTNSWMPTVHSIAMEKVREGIVNYGFAVVTMHHDDHPDGLLTQIETEGIPIASMNDIIIVVEENTTTLTSEQTPSKMGAREIVLSIAQTVYQSPTLLAIAIVPVVGIVAWRMMVSRKHRLQERNRTR